MASGPGGERFTLDQITAMRRTASLWTSAEGGYPQNRRVAGWHVIEAEDCVCTTSNRREVNMLELPERCGRWKYAQTNLLNDASLTVRFESSFSGRFRVWLLGVAATDYGRFTCRLDGRALQTVDLWCVGKHASGRNELGTVDFKPGSHELVFTSVSRHRMSRGDRIGIDAFMFEPVENKESTVRHMQLQPECPRVTDPHCPRESHHWTYQS